MTMSTQSIIDTRRYQMFPNLEPEEIKRLRRFGEVRSYGMGEALAKVGEVGHGLTVILAGTVDITQHDESGRREPIVTHGPGSFMGELAQLAGRPALVDAYAQEPVVAVIIPPERLRALLVAEAELGERIMRALILRRVGLLETGAGGPVIVGRAENGDVIRRLSLTQWASASEAQPRYRSRGEGADRTLPRRPRSVADCALLRRTIAAQP
jgi:thioredoxin reductase (NADPH)